MTFTNWAEDKAPRLGAALAFYSVLSIGPLLLIIIAIAGAVFGEEAARGRLVDQIAALVGAQGGQAIQSLLANTHKPDATVWASIIGMATLLLSASGVFGELQDALNTIWKVEPVTGQQRNFLLFIKRRFLSFSMVLGIGFLLLVSLSLTTFLSAVSTYMAGTFHMLSPFLLVLDCILTFAVITLLFAMIFKILPDEFVRWSDVWAGSVITAVLFTIGKFFIGLYLGHSAIASAYGAAGSVVVLIIWIYFSAQILYFGAEFTRVYAMTVGSRKKTNAHGS